MKRSAKAVPRKVRRSEERVKNESILVKLEFNGLSDSFTFSTSSGNCGRFENVEKESAEGRRRWDGRKLNLEYFFHFELRRNEAERLPPRCIS